MRLALIACLLFASAPAFAADSDPAPAKPAKEKKICRADDEASSVSRMRKRICKTAEQWENDRSARGKSEDR